MIEKKWVNFHFLKCLQYTCIAILLGKFSRLYQKIYQTEKNRLSEHQQIRGVTAIREAERKWGRGRRGTVKTGESGGAGCWPPGISRPGVRMLGGDPGRALPRWSCLSRVVVGGLSR